MRKEILALMLIISLCFVFSQDAMAADLPAGKVPATVPSAYEILGLVPAKAPSPGSGSQTQHDSAGNLEFIIPVQAEGQPEASSGSLDPGPALGTEAVLAAEDSPAESLVDELEAEAEPAMEATAEAEIEAMVDAEGEPVGDELPAETAEDALWAEIMRLQEERDELDETIRSLMEENELLAATVEEADYYRELAESLELRIASLESALADTELALAEAARNAAELSRVAAEAALAEALASGIVVAAPEKGIRETANGYLSGWSLDTSRFARVLRSDLAGSSARMGSWLVQGAGARQTDASQYFSRLELPLAQDGRPLLYSFKARATGTGWVGLGLHFFVEDVVKRRGYGEGKSLLIWFTRDQAARGVDTTYLQLYRSDNDVVMERMFDAAIGDSLLLWRTVDIVYDPGADYLAVSVDGVLRIVYKTFFGRATGATMALRTLGGGVEFADFSVRAE